ncbi:SPW repeat protein [Streptomyces sp. NPDC048266]|uniref:SPW repeat protein n=1 Tax=unclassified Streptomyces TaxID=2593676 RepID=UPI0033CB3BB3
MIEALALITVSLAVCPWTAGFNGFTTLPVTNLIAGIACMLLLGDLGNSYERTHSMAWAAAAIGIWTCVAPCGVAGDVAHTRSTATPLPVPSPLSSPPPTPAPWARRSSWPPQPTRTTPKRRVSTPSTLDEAPRQLTWARWAVPAGRVGGGVTQLGSVESRRESRLDITDCSCAAH